MGWLSSSAYPILGSQEQPQENVRLATIAHLSNGSRDL
jgi:hypothetical protein